MDDRNAETRQNGSAKRSPMATHEEAERRQAEPHRLQPWEYVRVNDPYVTKDKFIENLQLKLTNELDGALKGADIAVIATDHPEYKGLGLQ